MAAATVVGTEGLNEAVFYEFIYVSDGNSGLTATTNLAKPRVAFYLVSAAGQFVGCSISGKTVTIGTVTGGAAPGIVVVVGN